MNNPDVITISVAHECCDLLDTFDYPPPVGVAKARTRVASLLSIVNARATAQTNALIDDRAGGTARHAIREDLLDALRPIVTVAREDLTNIPELAALTMPRADAAAGTLILVANTAADLITRHAPVFAEHGLDANASTTLRALAARLDYAVAKHRGDQAWRSHNSAEITAECTQLRKALRVLDSFVLAWLRGDKDATMQWKYTLAGHLFILGFHHAA